jgi:hypothetical protein
VTGAARALLATMLGVSSEDPRGDRIVDFTNLAGRLRVAAITLGIVAISATVVEGMVDGLTFRVLGRWAAAYAAVLVLVSGVLVGVHAYRGADSAQRRGERLGSGDVGLLPPRRRQDRS